MEVANAIASAQIIAAEAKMNAMLKEAQGIRAVVAAQNTALPIAIAAQFLDKHGEVILERLPAILEALAPSPGLLGDRPTIIGGQGDVGGMLMSASAAGLLRILIGEGKLEAIINNIARNNDSQGSAIDNSSQSFKAIAENGTKLREELSANSFPSSS